MIKKSKIIASNLHGRALAAKTRSVIQLIIITLTESGKIYFASDFHLGLPAGSPPLEREKKVVSWLNSIAPDAKEIYLLGDIFDFWWEYKLVVPRGFTQVSWNTFQQ